MEEAFLSSMFFREEFDAAPLLELVLLLGFYFSFAQTWGRLVESNNCKAPSFMDYFRRWQLENNAAQLVVLCTLVHVLLGATTDGTALAWMRVMAWMFFASTVYVLGRKEDGPMDSPEAVLTESRMERLQWHRRWLRKRMSGARVWVLMMGIVQAWALLVGITGFIGDVAQAQEGGILGHSVEIDAKGDSTAIAAAAEASLWNALVDVTMRRLVDVPRLLAICASLVHAMLAFSELACFRSKDFVGDFTQAQLEAFPWPDGQPGHFKHQRKPERLEHGRSLRVVVVTVGTRGDVQPYVALGRYLADRGHRPVIASQWNHRGFVEAAGLDFVDVGIPALQQPEEWLTIQSIGEMMSTTVNYMLQRPMPEPEGPPGRVTPQPPGAGADRESTLGRSVGRGRAPSRDGPRSGGRGGGPGGASGYEVMMRAVYEVAKGSHVELQEGALRADGKRTTAEVGRRHWGCLADALVSTNHTLSQVQMTAAKLQLPMFNFKLQPDVCTAGYGPPGRRSHWNGLVNQWNHHATWFDIVRAAIASGITEQEKGFRRTLGLRDESFKGFFRGFYYQPTVGCFSRILIPSPDEDPDFQFTSGFFMTDDDEYQPPIGLAVFLRDGDILSSGESDLSPGPDQHYLSHDDTTLLDECAMQSGGASRRLSKSNSERLRDLCSRIHDHKDMPAADSRRVVRASATRPGYQSKKVVAVNFGSMVLASRSGLVARVVNEVLRRGMKCLLITGWADVPDGIEASNPDLLCMKGVPHGYAFRWVDCVVHHGGAGTTARVLSCSKPAIIVPILRWADQLQWAEWVDRRGFGVMIDEKDPPTASVRAALDKVFAPAKPVKLPYGKAGRSMRRLLNDVQKRTDTFGARLRVEPALERAEAALFSCLCEQMLPPDGVDVVRRDIRRVEDGAAPDFADVPDPESLSVIEGMCFIHCVPCHARRVELGLREGRVEYADGFEETALAALEGDSDAESQLENVEQASGGENSEDGGYQGSSNYLQPSEDSMQNVLDRLEDADAGAAAAGELETAESSDSGMIVVPQDPVGVSISGGASLHATSIQLASSDRLEPEHANMSAEEFAAHRPAGQDDTPTADDTDDGILVGRHYSIVPGKIDPFRATVSSTGDEGVYRGRVEEGDSDEDVDQDDDYDRESSDSVEDQDESQGGEDDGGEDSLDRSEYNSESKAPLAPREKFGSARHMLVSTYLESSPQGSRSQSRLDAVGGTGSGRAAEFAEAAQTAMEDDRVRSGQGGTAPETPSPIQLRRSPRLKQVQLLSAARQKPSEQPSTSSVSSQAKGSSEVSPSGSPSVVDSWSLGAGKQLPQRRSRRVAKQQAEEASVEEELAVPVAASPAGGKARRETKTSNNNNSSSSSSNNSSSGSAAADAVRPRRSLRSRSSSVDAEAEASPRKAARSSRRRTASARKVANGEGGSETDEGAGLKSDTKRTGKGGAKGKAAGKSNGGAKGKAAGEAKGKRSSGTTGSGSGHEKGESPVLRASRRRAAKQQAAAKPSTQPGVAARANRRQARLQSKSADAAATEGADAGKTVPPRPKAQNTRSSARARAPGIPDAAPARGRATRVSRRESATVSSDKPSTPSSVASSSSRSSARRSSRLASKGKGK